MLSWTAAARAARRSSAGRLRPRRRWPSRRRDPGRPGSASRGRARAARSSLRSPRTATASPAHPRVRAQRAVEHVELVDAAPLAVDEERDHGRALGGQRARGDDAGVADLAGRVRARRALVRLAREVDVALDAPRARAARRTAGSACPPPARVEETPSVRSVLSPTSDEQREARRRCSTIPGSRERCAAAPHDRRRRRPAGPAARGPARGSGSRRAALGSSPKPSGPREPLTPPAPARPGRRRAARRRAGSSANAPRSASTSTAGSTTSTPSSATVRSMTVDEAEVAQHPDVGDDQHREAGDRRHAGGEHRRARRRVGAPQRLVDVVPGAAARRGSARSAAR